jgi:hypothetical protein
VGGAALLAQESFVVPGFNAFGHDIHVQGLAELDDSPEKLLPKLKDTHFGEGWWPHRGGCPFGEA